MASRGMERLFLGEGVRWMRRDSSLDVFVTRFSNPRCSNELTNPGTRVMNSLEPSSLGCAADAFSELEIGSGNKTWPKIAESR